jgi:hypothetical protein
MEAKPTGLERATVQEKALLHEKSTTVSGGDSEAQEGHLQELEVNVAQVVHENDVFDENSDHSPYPEGKSLA